jgi:hypothetical protein
MPGNTALQTEVWMLALPEAKAVLSVLDTPKGSYWEAHVLKPYRRAARMKAASVTVFTAGFSTGELSNALYATGHTVTRTCRTTPQER